MFIAVYCKSKEQHEVFPLVKAMRDKKTQAGLRVIEFYAGDVEACDKVFYTEGCEAIVAPFTNRGIPVTKLDTKPNIKQVVAVVEPTPEPVVEPVPEPVIEPTTEPTPEQPVARRGRPRKGE